MEAKDVSEVDIGEGQLLVSEEATASGAVTISPTDMDGNAVTLTNDTEQVCKTSSVVVLLHCHRTYFFLCPKTCKRVWTLKIFVTLSCSRTNLWATGG